MKATHITDSSKIKLWHYGSQVYFFYILNAGKESGFKIEKAVL